MRSPRVSPVAFLSVMLIWVMLTTTWFVVSGVQRSNELERLARQGHQARVALLSLEHDLQKRVAEERISLARSEAFLRAHPNGIPGIPAALIKQSIDSLKRTIQGQLSTIAALDKALGDGNTST